MVRPHQCGNNGYISVSSKRRYTIYMVASYSHEVSGSLGHKTMESHMISNGSKQTRHVEVAC